MARIRRCRRRPAPQKGIPTLNPAKAVGWPKGGAPTAPGGLTVARYAEGLKHPRNLYVLPNGDALVVEANGAGHKGQMGCGLCHAPGPARACDGSSYRY